MNGASLLELLATTAWSVVLAVAPLAFLFLLFQVLFLRLPVTEVSRILTGTLVAAVGLFLFLLGVSLAFLPFGRLLGAAIAALSPFWRTKSRKPPAVRSIAAWCWSPSAWAWPSRSDWASCG